LEKKRSVDLRGEDALWPITKKFENVAWNWVLATDGYIEIVYVEKGYRRDIN